MRRHKHGRHGSIQKQQRAASKTLHRQRKAERRREAPERNARLEQEQARTMRRAQRKADSTLRIGDRGLRVCGNKVRYNNFHQAWDMSKFYTRKYGDPQYVYRCPIPGCGGYHLTTHPMGKTVWRYDFLLPSEVFQRSRESALRIRQIDVEKAALDERLGPQGHGYNFHSKSDILDPSRHVIEKLQETEELDYERTQCQRDVREAWMLVDGIEAGHEFGSEAAQLVIEYYIYGESLAQVARSTSYPADTTEHAIKAVVDWCDEQGCAKLLRAMERE